mmetsp:Transcript_65393/g.200256  ORF Transcript_65393/g.200256 Transcript_65393/m.200256 type:complete len:264 (-) Transcript_65393:957-1748(-)
MVQTDLLHLAPEGAWLELHDRVHGQIQVGELLHWQAGEVRVQAPLHRQMRDHQHRTALPFQLDDDGPHPPDNIGVRLRAGAGVTEVQWIPLPLRPDLRVLLLDPGVADASVVASVQFIEQAGAHGGKLLARAVAGAGRGADGPRRLRAVRRERQLALLRLLGRAALHGGHAAGHRQVLEGRAVHRRGPHEHEHLGAFIFPGLLHRLTARLEPAAQLKAIRLAAARDLALVRLVLALGVSGQPDAPGLDVDVAQVEADVTHEVS